jgi:RNA polymerase sigma-70 factor (ECF subfamily)
VSDELDDADIVRGLRQGDADAWEALCGKYSARVCRYVARLIGSDANAAADVFQETMLAAARGGRTIRAETNLWAWLATISHHQAALHWRRAYRDRSVPLETEPCGDSSQDPVERMSQSEANQSIRLILADMNAEHVALLTAKYIDEMSVQQMVTAFGGTAESLRSKLARARKDFRQRIDFRDRQELNRIVSKASPRDGEF